MQLDMTEWHRTGGISSCNGATSARHSTANKHGTATSTAQRGVTAGGVDDSKESSRLGQEAFWADG